ncbi:DUF5839 family protein [Liquorilactobacillus sicerae]|uniref:DUF5839 family protein n=1 Tax=Liquorilactobacillus sicerae TaxID=1416943 RepID=UPI0024807BFB|nr:DUF5839 family protein [Liquorilactobacillus sicerae]
MADNILMAYHIVLDPNDRTKHVLNTKKLYKWRITDKTKGTPVIGNVALVKTKFSKRVPVMIYATKEVANDLSNLQPVKIFTTNRDQEAVNKAFDNLLK